ncbi:MAG: DUF362 domain-containing protein [Candidatus Bathyarchaeia archaeon]
MVTDLGFGFEKGKERKKAIVSIVRDQDLKDKVDRALNLIGGMGKVLRKGDRVLLKPNLVDGAPAETGETTHPELIRAVAEHAFAAGAKEVYVGEGESYDGPRAALYKLIEKTVAPIGAKVINFNDEPFVEVSISNPVYFDKVRLAKAVLDCDVLVNLPTLKTHGRVGITVSIKNYYGAIPREDKGKYHRLDRVEEAIVDLNLARKSDLTVVDGTYSTIHWGPREEFPETHRLDLVIAGFDPVAVDTVSAKVIGVEPRTLRFLAWAERRGLGTARLEDIEVRGLSIEEAFRRATTTAVEYDNLRHKHIRLIDCGACTGCSGRIAALVVGLKDDGMKEDVYVYMGPQAKPHKGPGKVFLCGRCAAPTFYNELEGTYIPGCPVNLERLEKELRSLGAS